MPVFTIRHRTIYAYAEEVALSLNQARLRPRDLAGQRLLHFELKAKPDFEDYHEGLDFFGNPTSFFQLQKAHKVFDVTATSRVDVSWSEPDAPPISPAWEDVAQSLETTPTLELQNALHFALESPMVRPFAELRDYTLRSFTAGRPLADAAHHLMQRIHRDFRFRPGSTNVSTTLETVFQNRSGVCQDFSHLMIGCLRSIGLAARYVSGYLETFAPPGKTKLVGSDASHAWVSLFIPGTGWIDYDPTNRLLPGPRHITVAWGRDFSDVSPLRGVLYGGGSQKLKVEVDVTREDPKPKEPK
jgi:transglutaminase-like putative cysteine protease